VDAFVRGWVAVFVACVIERVPVVTVLVYLVGCIGKLRGQIAFHGGALRAFTTIVLGLGSTAPDGRTRLLAWHRLHVRNAGTRQKCHLMLDGS